MITTEEAACGRCVRAFDAEDKRWNGHARYQDTAWCRSCVDRCHESTDFAHACPVCTRCGCLAYDPVHNDHTEDGHTDCGWGYSGPCGGCDSCISAQVDYFQRRRAADTKEET